MLKLHSNQVAATKEDFVTVGRLGRPYGVQGWQHLQSFTDPIENIFEYETWYLQSKNGWEPVRLDAHRAHGAGWVIKLADIEQKETAALYSNRSIAVLKSELPALSSGEYYWTDLEGLSVQTESGTVVGKIDYLYENTGMDVMVVKAQDSAGKTKEHHIPFVWQDTILSVDLADQSVTIDWEFGLDACGVA